MAKKCPVRSLSDTSLAELANLVVSTIGYSFHSDLDNDITITMVEINTYLENCGATSDIYQELLRIILASDYLEASIRFTCLQMLLNGSVQVLITEIFPYSYYEKILQVIAAQGSGLRTLNLKGVWVKEDHMHYMFEIIRKCRNLTKLSIPYIANDDLLDVIAKYSKKLRYLDVSGETDITENGIESLCKGLAAQLRLTIIDIGMLGEENICHSDIAMLLENCPNLENLVTYSFVGEALKFVYENVDKNFKCRLRYIHDTKTSLEILEIIAMTCPHLESLYLDSPNHGILHKLNGTSLHKLKIYKFYCNELMQLLESMGNNLVHLTLIRGRGTLELGRLARVCPSLVDLDCYMMDMLSYNIDVKFDCLQGLEMLSSSLNLISLKRFVCRSTTLKRLAIDTIAFSDEDMFSIFVEHDFLYLEDIWFTSAANLTINTVELLMDRCPELQSIGQLSGWALTPDDLALIRGLLKSGNSCLILTENQHANNLTINMGLMEAL